MPKVKAAKTSKVQFVIQDFPEEFMKSSNNELYCDLCSCTISYKRFLVESHRNTSNHQKTLGTISELFIPHTLLAPLSSNNNDFV